MWNEFMSAWPLFGETYAGAVLLAALLGLIGVHVYARRQVFLGAALAQTSALGVTLALTTAAWHPFGLHLHHTSWYPRVWAIACAVAAAIVMECASRRNERRESLSGALFLFASATALLITANQPFGLEEVQRMLSSSLLVIGGAEVALYGALLAAAAIATVWGCDRMLLTALDPATASAAGLRVVGWQRGTAIAAAVTIGASIQSSGLLFTFANLLMPVLAATRLAREMRTLFLLAPALAALTTLLGLLLAHAGDYPPAQATVLLQTAVLVIAWGASALAPWFRQCATSCRR